MQIFQTLLLLFNYIYSQINIILHYTKTKTRTYYNLCRIRTTKEIIKTLSSLIGNNNNLNDNQLIINTKNKAHAREPTPWEILADTIVQQPKIEQKYQNVRTSKSTSLDNLLEVNENE